jgi:hypothetical protein
MQAWLMGYIIDNEVKEDGITMVHYKYAFGEDKTDASARLRDKLMEDGKVPTMRENAMRVL